MQQKPKNTSFLSRLTWSSYKVLLVIFGGLILLLNVRLYIPPSSTPEVIRPHLDFLKAELESGAGQEMQRLFPEGYLFSHELYGATWINQALEYPQLKNEALAEARWTLKKLEEAEAKGPFPPDLALEYGVFYRGWSNWLRGGIVALEPDGLEVLKFKEECEVLAFHLRSSGPYLDAYSGQAWPCDSTVAVACLALHDRKFGPRYQSEILAWKESVGRELFPHQVRPAVKPSRGTSQVMIQRFLFDIDPEFAGEHYAEFRRQFITTRFGLPGVREYPLGTDGPGDVDSGPLVFGFSLSATGVVPGAARLHGDSQVARPFGQLIASFGFPLRGRYLGGQVPVADALLLWSRTAVSWCGHPSPGNLDFDPVVSPTWRWGFHLFWTLLLLVLSLPWLWKHRRTS